MPAGNEDVAGNGYAFRALPTGISGLKPQTTYHYRLVAHNASGTSATPDATFTTRPADRAGAGLRAGHTGRQGRCACSTPTATTRRGPTATRWSTRPRTRWTCRAARGSPVEARYASRRTSTGWDLRPLDRPAGRRARPVSSSSMSTIAVSSDFSHALVSQQPQARARRRRRALATSTAATSRPAPLELVATGLPYNELSGPSGSNVLLRRIAGLLDDRAQDRHEAHAGRARRV